VPTNRINVTIKHKGVIMDAAASKAAAARAVIRMNDLLAEEGATRVRKRLDNVLRNPTGYYQSRIGVEKRQVFRGITDNRVPYGGWLEGVDDRNKSSRFPGYHTFRTVREGLNQDKAKLIEPILKQFIQELNS
jgi:hypothetical protein